MDIYKKNHCKGLSYNFRMCVYALLSIINTAGATTLIAHEGYMYNMLKCLKNLLCVACLGQL